MCAGGFCDGIAEATRGVKPSFGEPTVASDLALDSNTMLAEETNDSFKQRYIKLLSEHRALVTQYAIKIEELDAVHQAKEVLGEENVRLKALLGKAMQVADSFPVLQECIDATVTNVYTTVAPRFATGNGALLPIPASQSWEYPLTRKEIVHRVVGLLEAELWSANKRANRAEAHMQEFDKACGDEAGILYAEGVAQNLAQHVIDEVNYGMCDNQANQCPETAFCEVGRADGPASEAKCPGIPTVCPEALLELSLQQRVSGEYTLFGLL